MDVTLKNNTTQSLSVYYYVGSDERLMEVPAGQTVTLSNISSLSPSTDRLVRSKYLSVSHAVPPTEEETLPLSIKGMAWAGAWNQRVAYHYGYVVSHLGTVWVAKKPSKNAEPSLSSSYWEVIGVQELNSILQIDIQTIPVGSVIYRDEDGWTFGQLDGGSILGSIPIDKITGLETALDGLLSLDGGDITGDVTYSGQITADEHLVNKAYADLMLPKTGGTMTGAVEYDGPIVGANQLANRAYVDSVIDGLLPKSGGILTGLLTLYANPTQANHAATKAYADLMLPKTGGAMSGFLQLHAAPTDGTHAATKAYVDAKALAGGTLTGKLKLPTGNAIDDDTDLTNKAYVDAKALAGGILTGKFQLPLDITVSANEDVPNKLYVDSAFLEALSRGGGVMNGLIYYSIPRSGVSAVADTDLFTLGEHGFKSGRAVIPTFSAGFGGLTSGNTYFVVAVEGDDAGDTFKLAETFGNSAVGAAGSTTMYTSSTASLVVGQELTGTGFQTGTIISRIDGPTEFTISHTLLLSQPRPLDVTSDGIGAVFTLATQEPDDQLPTRGYINDAFGISGDTLSTAGGTMSGPILGSHGLVQTDGGKRMTGSLIMAELPDITLDDGVPREWAVLGFAYHSLTETKVYLDDITAWAVHHDIRITGTVLYDGVHAVLQVDKENGYLVISHEFDGTVSGIANQYTGGLYFSTTENGLSYRRRKLVSRGAVSIQGGDYAVQPSDGVVLSAASTISIIDLGDPADAIGQVVVKKLGDSTGSFVIVKSGGSGEDSNLVLDTKEDSVTMEALKDADGNLTWVPVARIRNGEDVARALFRGCLLRYPGSIDVDISTQRSYEKTTKVLSVASVIIAATACLELTVEDASAFETAGVITVEGSTSGYNGNYAEGDIISIDTDTNVIVLTNINEVDVVNESNFFLVASVNSNFKSNLALSVSPVINDIRQTPLAARIAGFASAGFALSEPSSSSEPQSQYTDVILGNNVIIEDIENVPVVIDGVATTGDSAPYSLYRPGHGLVNGDQVVFTFDDSTSSSSSAAGSSSSSEDEVGQFGGLVNGETYFVTNVVDELDDEFDLSLTDGGPAIAVTTPGINGVLTKTGSSGVLKVSLNRDEFDGAFVNGELTAGDRVNINWTSTGSGSYDGSYVLDSVDIGDDETLPSVTIRGQYIGEITSDSPKLAEVVDTSAWIPGFHLVLIQNYADYNGLYDLIATDPVYGKLTIKKEFVLPSGPSDTPGVDAISTPTHIINQHPTVYGKVLSGEGTGVVSARTDGDGDLTVRLRNPITDTNPELDFPQDIARISNEITGAHLHAISGGIFDLTGEVVAKVVNAVVYSSTIVSGGGVAVDGNVTFLMNNVIGFKEGDSVRISDEDVDRTVVEIDGDYLTVNGGDYTITGTTSITNSYAVTVVLDDQSSGAFDVGDPVIIRGVTSLGSDFVKTTVSGVAPLLRSPYTAPRIVIRGFNRAVDDPNGEPLPVQSSGAEDSLLFENIHGIVTGQKVRLKSGSTLYTGFSASADVYAIRTGVASIKVATSLTNAYEGRAINLNLSASATVTPLVAVSVAFDSEGSISGTAEVAKILNMYSIRPWTWMSWRGIATTVDSNLSVWDDYSGNLREFRQATAGNRPAYVTSGFNNVSAIRYISFTANNKAVAHALAAEKTQALTVVFVAKLSGDGIIFKSGPSLRLARDGDGYALSGDGGTEIVGGRSGTAAGVYTIVLNGSSSRFRKFTSFAAAPQEVHGTISGSLETTLSIGSTTGGFNGSLASFMVFSSALNDDQISFIERALAYEHGITVLSNNAILNSLVLTGVVFSPSFNGYVTSGYSINVANLVSETAVTAVPVQPNATMRARVNAGSWSSLTSGVTGSTLALSAGANTIEIEVTAQDDTTVETYSINILRLAPPTVTLPTVGSVGGDSAVLGGTVSADNGASITQRGVVCSPTATNSNPLIGGTGVTTVLASGTIGSFTALVTGLLAGTAYTFKAFATNSEGTSYTSTDTFSTASDNALLSGLALSDGVLDPSFDQNTFAYASEVVDAISFVSATPTAAQENATIEVRVNGGGYSVVTSGSPSDPLGLSTGANTIDVRVTAQDAVTVNVYTITVTRLAP